MADPARFLHDPEPAPRHVPLVDAHVHLFPPRVFEAIWRWFDAHGWPIRYRVPAEEVVGYLDRQGVERFFALHYSHAPGMARVLNRFVSEMARRSPRVVPFGTVLPGAVITSDYGSLLQGFLAILDGSTALAVALLTRRLGGGRDAARFALLLYAGNISAFAALQFGFSAQIFGQWLTAVLTMSLLGIAGYLAYPAAPPWLAAQRDEIGAVERISHLGWDGLGLDAVGGLVELGQSGSNPVAAMPSLHAAAALLAALFLWPWVSRLSRVLLAAYALAMALTLVYTGEHYVVDVLAGWLVAAVGVVVARLAHRRPDRPEPSGAIP